MVENEARAMSHHLRRTPWERVLPGLDPGHLGAGTGNAGTGARGTQPIYEPVGAAVLPADAAAGDKFAVQLYEDATVADGYPRVYPPDDTGWSGLAICKVLKTRGTITAYRWARSAY